MRTRKQIGRLGGLTLFALALATRPSEAAGVDDLAAGFAQPPEETRPSCYWYWISDNISKDGITKDLEAMARVGIGEAFIGNINQNGARGSIKILTPEWVDAMTHAFREGNRTGVKVGTFNSPGWSQSGGPWVTAKETMRYLVRTQTRVTGPTKFSQKLPATTRPYQDVEVLAYPEPARDRETLASRKPKVTSSVPTTRPSDWVDDDNETSALIVAQEKGKPPAVVDLTVAEPFTARSLSLVPGPTRFSTVCELYCEDADGKMTLVRKFNASRASANYNVATMPRGPVVISFPAVTSKHFQLKFTSPVPGGALGAIDISEIELSAAPRLEEVVEKQLGKMHPTPRPNWDSYVWKTQAEPEDPSMVIKPGDIQNLSSKLAPDGTLTWDVPAGDWIIERIGMTPTGAKNSPAPKEGTGYEIDKMTRSVIPGHYDAYVGKVMEKLTPEEIKNVGHVIADSYEQGSENWTDGFDKVFKDTYGYDPLPWLSVLSGRLVGSATQSERFLWDLRRLVADRVATEYVGGMREALAAKGLRLWLENYGHWGFPSDFMKYGSESSDVGGEFWAGGANGENLLGSIELRAAASCVHGYGKDRVSAEAFTGGPAFRNAPWDLKARGDWAMTEGINHFVLHVYIHQPDSDKLPGVNAWFGTEFNRNNTWFEESRGWIDYLRRSNFLLQQGKYAADIAYFIGDDAPKMTGPRDPELPAGYAFDFINSELIQRMTVEDGKLVLPSGMRYRILVLSPQTTMRPELLVKLKELVAAGGAILGPMPTESPSMQNYPACDAQVKQLAAEVWQDCDGKQKTHVAFGKGHVFNGVTLKAAFDELKYAADIDGLDTTFPWIHRTDENYDIYFISNQKNEVRTVPVSFRVSGRQPELWDAVTGEHRDLPQFTQKDGRTEVPLQFEPRQSVFVVFAKPASNGGSGEPNFRPLRTVQTLGGPWTVKFDPKRGAPVSVVFNELADWTQRPEPGIQHYSGTATYVRTFDAPQFKSGEPVYLNIGEITGMARVRVNGKDVGPIWCAPWTLNVAPALKPGSNELEIEIANTWLNQLLFDATQPKGERATSLTVSPNLKGAKPQKSGMIGPVLLQVE